MVMMNILKMLHGVFVAIAVFIVTMGVAVSVWNLIKIIVYPSQAQVLYSKARWALCQYIVFGLEFMIAGDVVHTLLMPDYQTTIILGAMVLIRTILSYFINLEMALMEKTAANTSNPMCACRCASEEHN